MGFRTVRRAALVLAMACTLAALVPACAEDEFRVSQVPGGGTIAVNDADEFALYLNFITWITGASETTITMNGSYFNPETSQTEFPTLILTVPNGITFQHIELEDTDATFNDASFGSDSVSGEAEIFDISPSRLSGQFEATFDDGTGTRSLSHVNFVVNDFSTRP